MSKNIVKNFLLIFTFLFSFLIISSFPPKGAYAAFTPSCPFWSWGQTKCGDWVNDKCGGGDCAGDKMRKIQQCCKCLLGGIETGCWIEDKCVSDSSCQPRCSCGSWQKGDCGGWECPSKKRYQYRTCSPSGCDEEKRCVTDSACEASLYICGDWKNGSCGGGSCSSTKRYQYRTCFSSSIGYFTEDRCVSDSSCQTSAPTPTPTPTPAPGEKECTWTGWKATGKCCDRAGKEEEKRYCKDAQGNVIKTDRRCQLRNPDCKGKETVPTPTPTPTTTPTPTLTPTQSPCVIDDYQGKCPPTYVFRGGCCVCP